MPRAVITLFNRSGAFLLTLTGLVLVGGAVTTAICAFTPVCTISFASLPFVGLRNNAVVIANHVTENITDAIKNERVRRAVDFFNTAIEKYEQMQHTFKEKNIAKV